MELWIRSQDKKTLMKITRIYMFMDTLFSIDSRENELILGKYKTEKRALEVLDEIQEKITVRKENEYSVEYIMINDVAPIMYEMPKK